MEYLKSFILVLFFSLLGVKDLLASENQADPIKESTSKLVRFLTNHDFNGDYLLHCEGIINELIETSRDDSLSFVSSFFQNQNDRMNDLILKVHQGVIDELQNINFENQNAIRSFNSRYDLFIEALEREMQDRASQIRTQRLIVAGVLVSTAYILLRRSVRLTQRFESNREQLEISKTLTTSVAGTPVHRSGYRLIPDRMKMVDKKVVELEVGGWRKATPVSYSETEVWRVTNLSIAVETMVLNGGVIGAYRILSEDNKEDQENLEQE